MRKGERVLLGDIDATIRQLNITNDVAVKAITKIYRQAYRGNKAYVDDMLKAVRGEVTEIQKTSQALLSPMKAEYKKAASIYTEGRA